MTEPRYTDALIDSPLSPFSTPAEIRTWITELEKMREDFVAGSDGLRRIASALDDAKELLAAAEESE